MARQVFETLVRPEEGGTKIVPGLAETWTPDAAGTDWTFKLRTGVKFHDGTDFNAEAVCVNFDRWYNSTGLMQSPDVTAYWQDVMGGFAKNENPDLADEPLQVLHRQGRAHCRTSRFNRVSSKFPAALMLPSFSIAQPEGAAAVRRRATSRGTAEDIKYPAYAHGAPDRHRPVQVQAWDVANKTLDPGAQRGLLRATRPS